VLVLGLDPSLRNFGWALHESGGVGRERCIERGRFQAQGNHFLDEIARYMYLREELLALLARCGTVRVGIEHPIFGESQSEGMYALFMFCLEALKASRCDVVFFAPPTVKTLAREILGRPKTWKMEKAEMVESARKDTGGGSWDHNEADAYLIGRAAARFWSLLDGLLTEEDLTPEERRTFLEIHHFVRGKHAGQTEINGILHRESERFFRWSQDPLSWTKKTPRRRK